jgi:arginine decarboxylase
MVWHHTVAPGDVVVVDRNCHKSILHSIIMTGAVPVFLTPTRNHYGIIGPIPQASSRPRRSRRKIAPTRCWPAWIRSVKPRILTLTQSTYDGVLYNTETIKQKLDGYDRHLHFDEAWLPHAAFHKFYGSFHAMGKNRPRPKEAMVYATQSTHKLLAGISQASQVLVQDAQSGQARPAPLQRGLPDAHQHQPAVRHHRQLRRGRGHDGAARRHRAGGGEHAEALDFRRAMRKVDKEFGKDWWFKVWGPDKLAPTASARAPTGCSRPTTSGTASAPGRGFNMLDPIKCTLITPGLDMSGKFAKTGIPAAIVTKFLAEHGVVVEKTGLYSFFIMFTIGITKGRWNTLLTALQQFKDDYDRNAPLWRILPEFCAAHPRYERMGLRDLCQRSTRCLRQGRRRAADHRDVPVGPAAGHEAQRRLCAHRAPQDRARGHRRAGRAHHHVAADALPAGHPAADPGRALQPQDRRLPALHARVQRAFPGFDTDVHGLVEDDAPAGGARYYVDCVKA